MKIQEKYENVIEQICKKKKKKKTNKGIIMLPTAMTVENHQI